MKYCFFFLLMLFAFVANAQHSLQKIWESDTIVAVPESVLFDAKKGVLYVSQIDGAPDGRDGKGGIAKMNLKGKMIKQNWVRGLNAPKGMGIYKNKFYAADLTEVVEIDLRRGRVLRRIPVEGAQFLNDITIDDKGVVYVSDSRTGKVHRIEWGKVSTHLTGLTGVNGLRAIGSDLYVLTSKELLKSTNGGQPVKIAELEKAGDGIEPVGNGDFIVSSWSGFIHYITADGKRELLLDTSEQKKNTADIGYDPAKRIVYVPTFFAKSVAAYQLQ